jgi:branched-chain amino acid transport system substrate-binding protein
MKRGFGGRSIEVVYVDEAGGPTKVVTEYRNLVERQNVDLVIGVISSGDCLAVAPVAEEMKKLTVLFDCATNRIFEEGSYKYVFRTTTMATQENVAAARYIAENYPDLKAFSGINPNYAWGQDAWSDFTEAMKIIKPEAQIGTIVWPKLGAGQYGTEISAVLGSGGEIVHNGLWGGDLEAYILQAAPRGLLAKMPNIIMTGETVIERMGEQLADGTILGARGPNGPFAPPTPLNKWFAILPLRREEKREETDEVIGRSNTSNSSRSPAQWTCRSARDIRPCARPYGTVKKVDGKVTLTNIRFFRPSRSARRTE